MLCPAAYYSKSPCASSRIGTTHTTSLASNSIDRGRADAGILRMERMVVYIWNSRLCLINSREYYACCVGAGSMSNREPLFVDKDWVDEPGGEREINGILVVGSGVTSANHEPGVP